MKRASLSAAFLLAALAVPAFAAVKLPAIISDNMVLQADKPLPIWGTADPHEKITVTLGDQTASTTADDAGKWRVNLPPEKAGQALEMTVAGSNTLTVKNILVGAVWICSGQSNMEFGLKNAHNAATEVPQANYPKVRLFTVKKNASFTPLADCTGQWVECTPESVATGGWGGFSAVAYFFGRDYFLATQQPVGLIHTSWGGTPAQSWTSLDALGKNPELKEAYGNTMHKIIAGYPAASAAYKKALPPYQEAMKQWNEEHGAAYQATLQQWNEEVAKAKAEGKPAPKKPDPVPPQPKAPANPDASSWSAAALYNAMIAPLVPYAIEGAIWYQGESNASKASEYRTLFPAMITDWREKWGQGNFPFLFVQLASFMDRAPQPVNSNWASLRDAQTHTLTLPNTGMAVTIDIGEAKDIHPKDKADVGHRLFLAAQRLALGDMKTVLSPLYAGMKIEDNKIRIRFTDVGGGLMIGVPPPIRVDAPASQPATELQGFAIRGADGKWLWAQAKIDGNTVLVWNDQIPHPTAVRYAWGDNPQCNLYNQEHLPASPFETEDAEKK